MENNNSQIIVKKGNGMGVTGFVIALIAFVFCWLPILNWILWILGLIFSVIGMFKKPKGFAIAGLCITFFWLILTLVILGAVL